MKLRKGFYERFIKRPQDLVISLSALFLLSPMLLIVAILVKAHLGSPVLFVQERPGLNEKIFKMYKFRTMNDDKDDRGELLPDAARLTTFGKMLRSTSLDELPELLNIVRGEMAVVGPRPQLVRDMVFMTPEQRKRHSVRPGLTGWAQINGRNNIIWEEKLALDLEYIANITFANDWKIILVTVAHVFVREGISSAGMDTAEDLGDYFLRIGKIDRAEYERKQALSSTMPNT